MTTRKLDRIIKAQPTSDGAGVKLFRSLGQTQFARLDPFLMLDEFRSDQAGDYLAGFPSHPHRGFETVTYMLAGRMRHEDHMGNSGLLESGGVQWMTAGRGIVHSEMPEQEDGLMHGFQLWINLPSGEKMKEPAYQEFTHEQVPVVEEPGRRVRIIAGEYAGVQGAVSGISTEPYYLHVSLDAGEKFHLPIPAGHNAFIYVFGGNVHFSDGGFGKLDYQQAGIFGSEGEAIELTAGEAEDNSGSSFLVLAAQPLNEPVAQYGPFVMNTREEIEQAMRDYAAGNFGR